ncbi:MAG TPA: S8 family serine peptidase [Gemmatimonadaceae bacterium]|nr:S8 family serine peptidase [Gemmatimonadaceae bacterium]
MPLRANLRQWSVILAPTAALLAACTDAPTRIAAPTSSAAVRTSLSPASGIPTGKTVVIFKDTSSIPLAGLALLNSVGGTVTTRWDNIGVAFVSGLSTSALATLSANTLVESVGSDRILNWLPNVRTAGAIQGDAAAVPQNNPANASYYANGTQWNMRVIQADKAWVAGKQGLPSTRVAILDTGIDYGHREIRTLVDLNASESFANLIVGVADGVPSVSAPIEPQLPGDSAFMDNHFHGTHVASTVASNNISVASIAPDITLIAVKVLSMTGSGSFESVASGIRHAAGPANADVINMSLGAGVEPGEEGAPALLELMRRVIKDAEKQGAVVISAAGNAAINLDVGTIVYTPCEQSTICVSATGPLMQQNFDQPAEYTNYGMSAIEVAAPGGNASDTAEYVNQDLIIGACSRRAGEAGLAPCRVSTDGVVYFYAYAAGTSMASPHVAGQAAMIKSDNPSLSVAGIRAKILGTADDIGVKGRDIYSNYGRINVARALGLK